MLDASAVIDATSTNSKFTARRKLFSRVWAEHECYVTPITISEVLHYIKRNEVGEKRQNGMLEILEGSETIPITEELAYHLAEISDQIVGLQQLDDMHDRWQMACADYHGMALATQDGQNRKQKFLTIISADEN